MTPPLVSILVVCHNDWPHVELALESALNQSYPALEVIVVDNGSTDATATQIPARYGNRVRYVRQANLGAARGRNTAMKLARGEFFQYLDGDDFLAPNKVAAQVAYLQAHPQVDIAYGDIRCFRSEPTLPAASLSFDHDFQTEADIKQALIQHGLGTPIIWLLRRRVYDRIGPQASLFLEDYDYMLRAAFAGCQFGHTPGVLAFYRRRQGQKAANMLVQERAQLAVLLRAKKYITEEPYRGVLLDRIASMRAALAHYELYRGKPARCVAEFRRAQAASPRQTTAPFHRLTRQLAHLPTGAFWYGVLRRARRLPAPFSAYQL